MTFQQHLTEMVSVIDGLLRYLPLCDNQAQFDGVMQEVRRLRKEVSEIEEMTKTERQRDIKTRIITVESKMNIY